MPTSGRARQEDGERLGRLVSFVSMGMAPSLELAVSRTRSNDEEETTVDNEESGHAKNKTNLRRRPVVDDRPSSTTLHKIANHDYQTDPLSFFLSVQVPRVIQIFGIDLLAEGIKMVVSVFDSTMASCS